MGVERCWLHIADQPPVDAHQRQHVRKIRVSRVGQDAKRVDVIAGSRHRRRAGQGQSARLEPNPREFKSTRVVQDFSADLQVAETICETATALRHDASCRQDWPDFRFVTVPGGAFVFFSDCHRLQR